MDNAELEKLLLETPAKIKIQEKALLLLIQRQTTNSREMEDIETPIKSRINSDSSYKNADQRKGACDYLLRNHVEYQGKLKKQPEYDFDVKNAQVELLYLRDMFRAYLVIAGMCKS